MQDPDREGLLGLTPEPPDDIVDTPLERLEPPLAHFTLRGSKGTYVRSLARDLGDALGCGGHLTALRRTRVGPYGLDRAVTLEQAAEGLAVLPIADAARAAFPARELTDDEARKLAHGHRLDATGTGPVPVAAFAPDGRLVALVSDTGPTARPLVVLSPA